MEWSNLGTFVFGSLIGSFLNVCIVRLPRDESVNHPRSHCRSCQKTLPFYDLIPIVSYLWRRGKCRFCNASFSIDYLIVELLAGCLSVVTFNTFGFRAMGLAYFSFVASLIAITFIDIHHRIIPDVISMGGTVLGFLLSFYFLTITPLQSFLGILSGGGILFLLAYFYFKSTKREGLGGGDIKLAAMIGAFLGYQGVFLTLFIGSMLGAVWGLIMMIIKKQNLQYALPFGPFLALGALIVLFYGDHIFYFLGYNLAIP